MNIYVVTNNKAFASVITVTTVDGVAQVQREDYRGNVITHVYNSLALVCGLALQNGDTNIYVSRFLFESLVRKDYEFWVNSGTFKNGTALTTDELNAVINFSYTVGLHKIKFLSIDTFKLNDVPNLPYELGVGVTHVVTARSQWNNNVTNSICEVLSAPENDKPLVDSNNQNIVGISIDRIQTASCEKSTVVLSNTPVQEKEEPKVERTMESFLSAYKGSGFFKEETEESDDDSSTSDSIPEPIIDSKPVVNIKLVPNTNPTPDTKPELKFKSVTKESPKSFSLTLPSTPPIVLDQDVPSISLSTDIGGIPLIKPQPCNLTGTPKKAAFSLTLEEGETIINTFQYIPDDVPSASGFALSLGSSVPPSAPHPAGSSAEVVQSPSGSSDVVPGLVFSSAVRPAHKDENSSGNVSPKFIKTLKEILL